MLSKASQTLSDPKQKTLQIMAAGSSVSLFAINTGSVIQIRNL